jgi:MinD-like ATPase involved in chromosome partitioning or flagellar assembly
MTDVITGLSPLWESLVATTLESAVGVTVTRRCADVSELVSVAEAGVGQCAVVSEDLRGLDLTLVHRLEQGGTHVLGLYPAGDEGAERRLRQLGIGAVLSLEADSAAFSAAVQTSVEPRASSRPGPLDLPGGQGVPELVPAFPDLPSGHGAQHQESVWASGAADAMDAMDAMDARDAMGGWQPAGSEPHTGTESDLPERPGRSTIIAVWGPAGAPGRTTVAVNVSTELATRGQQVLLVDADTYGGCVAQSLGLLDEAPGVAAACRAADQGSLDLPALARLAPYVTPGLRVLTGLPKAERWPELRAGALDRVLELARGLASVVVVDCGFCIEDDEELSYDTTAPRRNEATLTALAAADTLLAVGGADPVALQRFVRAVQDLGSVPSPAPVPVINRVRSSAVGARPRERIADSLRRFAGIEGIRFVPDDADVVDAAMLAGRSVVEDAPDSTLRASYAELVTAVAPWTVSRTNSRRRGWRQVSRAKHAQGAKRMVSPANV